MSENTRLRMDVPKIYVKLSDEDINRIAERVVDRLRQQGTLREAAMLGTALRDILTSAGHQKMEAERNAAVLLGLVWPDDSGQFVDPSQAVHFINQISDDGDPDACWTQPVKP